MATKTQAKTNPKLATLQKPKRKSPNILPIVIVGGIDPKRTYSVPEFMAITRVTRQALSRMRRKENGLVVRDCGGSPQILGQDWLDFCERAPKHIAKQRRTGGCSSAKEF